uniref:Translation initiation factor IF-2, chloroplastic n=1 Tax=Liagoropsis maxima TaxID=1653392 RepID=A0A1G4NVZ0_9FLOR|nr:Translation initiation factor 2 [Liagoropsis maxima]SCW22784.1 Translation initiation factor 2 [Liagoropsis maxima]
MYSKYIQKAKSLVSKDIQGNWLNLENPKIIYTNSLKTTRKISPVSSINDPLIDDSDTTINNRQDRKNKIYNKSIDLLESKKHKIKVKKKTRSKIHISDDDDNLDNKYSNLSKRDKNLELSLMRPEKPLKKKVSSKDSALEKNINKIKSSKTGLVGDEIQCETKPDFITLVNPVSIQDLSNMISVPAAEIIKSLFLQGISVTINQVIDISLAESIAKMYSISIRKNLSQETKNDRSKIYVGSSHESITEIRAPIVTIFGHVDHGKTTLLDTISHSNNTTVESGGITQSIVAHEVFVDYLDNKEKIIFLDTPGHEAFSDMRTRSIQVTDIGILVVAADDGLHQQSKEPIKYFQEHSLPFIVVINKIDKEEANADLIKQELAKLDIIPKDWGGSTPIIEVSALKGTNINLLLETILNITHEQVLLVDSSMPGSGTILDAYLDKKRGPIANLLVQSGTIRTGDYIITDQVVSKVRAIVNRSNINMQCAGPSSIVNVCGLESIPISGSLFEVIANDKDAKKLWAEYQKNKDKISRNYKKLNAPITVDSSRRNKYKTQPKIINIILKTDSEGTIDAIINAFMNISQEKVQLNVIAAGVGEVTRSDINLASVSQAIILGFNAIVTSQIKQLVLKYGITSVNFKVIYDLINYVQDAMLKLVDADYKEHMIGKAIVENIFVVSKGTVAGCVVTSGKLRRNSYIKVIRNKEIIYSGQLNSLKRGKEDVEEVIIEHECGVMSNNFDSWRKQDSIEAYDLIAQEKTL